MRKLASEIILEQLETNKDLYILTGDLGYGMWDKHFQYFPEQIINVGAAEQTMMDMAVGLSYEGKTVITYTITPFYLRSYETLRTYIDHEKLPVIMLGSGRDKDYAHDGYSHDASDIKDILKPLKNIHQYYPMKEDIKTLLQRVIQEPIPCFISLKR